MKILITLLAAFAMPSLALASPPSADSQDARAIMQAVYDRPTGDRVVARMEMTISDRAGHKRERVVQSRALKFAKGTKSLLFFESPPDVYNTGLLSIDYDDGNVDDDQWLYLPSLHKATRIASGDKSGAFMGSDFSYADLTRADPAHYDYSMVQASATVEGEACWVVEARPRTDKAKKETGYLKTHLWVSKSKLLPVQAKAWITQGKRLKYLKFADVQQKNGIWAAHLLSARTMVNNEIESTTTMRYSTLTFDNPSVVEADFTERRLEKGL